MRGLIIVGLLTVFTLGCAHIPHFHTDLDVLIGHAETKPVGERRKWKPSDNLAMAGGIVAGLATLSALLFSGMPDEGGIVSGVAPYVSFGVGALTASILGIIFNGLDADAKVGKLLSGETGYRAKDPEVARNVLRLIEAEKMRKGPSHSLSIRQGKALEAMGDLEEALRAYKIAAKLGPYDPALNAKIWELEDRIQQQKGADKFIRRLPPIR